MSIHSRLLTLQELDERNYFFTVPIYQRLYVWGKDQVNTLLEDLLVAYQQKKDFYLGTTLVVERKTKEPHGTTFDLIDGQQRFTTLWMMSLVWQEAMQRFLYCDQESRRRPRITFAIREKVNAFFDQKIAGKEIEHFDNPRIEDALATIESFFEAQRQSINLPDFTRFLFEKVKLVLTQVPPHTDLNKLFEVINHRGLQLQHHEILKARLLSRVSDPVERQRYALLWDACADMGRYVEKNLKDLAQLKISTLYDDKVGAEGWEDLASAEKVLRALICQQAATKEGKEPLPLAKILAGETWPLQDSDKESAPPDLDDESYGSDEVRSILNFPLLLQHTLRIWLQRKGKADLPRIRDKELLELFETPFLQESATEKEVKSFIELLWEIRYCFDKHVIKWVTTGEEEQHLICKLQKNKDPSCRLVRNQPNGNEGFALLQSMLYHSQQITTHYWLTPLLAWLHSHRGKPPSQHYAYLRHLDNHLFCAADERSLMERTRDFLENPWHRNNPLGCRILEEAHGTGFPHYWFYKLEFVLWYLKSSEMKGKDPGWNNFRMRAKNSVEHISPQTAQEVDSNRVSKEVLDTFGNLALVSRSLNSEYGNKSFEDKRKTFRKKNKDNIDSLKMALIYENNEWNDELAKAHQSEMIALMNRYLKLDHKAQAEG